MAEKVLRIGVVGLYFAQRQLLQAITDHPHTALVAGQDASQEVRDKFDADFGGMTYSDVEGLCNSPDLDAVYVASSNELHAEHVIMAAEHKKQIIVEKPIALSLAECDAMIAAADSNGVRLLAGHAHAFDVSIRTMSELVASGRYGRFLILNSWYYTDWLRRPRLAEDYDAAKGGGVVFRQGPHHVDLARMVGGGMVKSVRGWTSLVDDARPVEASYVATLSFEGGAVATLTFSGYGNLDSGVYNWRIGEGGERGKAPDHEMQPVGEDAPWRREQFKPASVPRWDILTDSASYQTFFGLNVISCEKADLRQSPDGILVHDGEGMHELVVPKGPMERESELSELYNAWAADGPLTFHDGRWAKATLEVCLAIMQSAKEQREIPMAHQLPYRPL